MPGPISISSVDYDPNWYKVSNKKISPNPKSDNYRIIDHWQFDKYLVIKIKYSDCTNYEGVKVLVFRATMKELKKQRLIDPHFSENKDFISPIARFEPTKEGWIDAVNYVKAKINKRKGKNGTD